MSMTRGRPGSPAVRKGRAVGPDYPEENFHNPFNAGIDTNYGDGRDKAIDSPASTTLTGAGLPLHEDTYDKLFEGK